MTEHKPQYTAQLITATEWKVILRARQCRGATIHWDTDRDELTVSGRVENLQPRQMSATAPMVLSNA